MVEEMAIASTGDNSSHSLAELYRRLDSVDFTRAIAQGAEESLRVVAAPPCGWSDLWTPKRVADTLRRLDRLASSPRLTKLSHTSSIRAAAPPDLTAQRGY